MNQSTAGLIDNRYSEFYSAAMPMLESYRGRDIIGVEELASVATSLIEDYSRETSQGRVRVSISPRTVRHYLSESLLGDPTGQAGTSTIFNYGNLLRLLAVKKLLADHWSVIKIKEFMRALDITALEGMVNNALATSAQRSGDSKAGREREGTHRPSAKQRLVAGDASEDDEASSSTSFMPPQLSSLTVESARRQERAIAEWVEIMPGLEIKVRRSFRPPATEEERARLATRFWSVVLKDE